MGILEARTALDIAAKAIQDAQLALQPQPDPVPHYGLTDRNVYEKEPLPQGVTFSVGARYIDDVFKTPITRVTDANTQADAVGCSWRTPASTATRNWNASSSAFCVIGTSGQARVVELTSLASIPIPATFTNPEWHPTNPNLAFAAYGAAPNHHTLGCFDLRTGQTSAWLNLDDVVPGLSARGDTYIGGHYCGGEDMAVLCGGGSQDMHDTVVILNINRRDDFTVLNAVTRCGFHLHSIQIDASGRFVMLTPALADRAQATNYVWDLQRDTITPLTVASSGHTDTGYGVLCNQDTAPDGRSWDAYQWCFRKLDALDDVRGLVDGVTPRLIYGSDHQNWNHAVPDRLRPIISATYRYGAGLTDPAWRAWDDEILAIPTDGSNAPVRRFCHHRSAGMDQNFWATPRPQVSPDGKWCLFTSTWEKSLGLDVFESWPPNSPRQDVFLIPLSDV